MTLYYYTIGDSLYSLTQEKEDELRELHGDFAGDEEQANALEWIEENGNYIGVVACY